MKSNSTSTDALRQGVEDSAFRVLVDSVLDYAILMIDPQGRILTWNAGAAAIVGYAAEEIIGAHISRFFPPESLASHLPERELKTAAAVGRFEDEGWRLRKDGTRFWASVIVTRLTDPNGGLIGFAKITRDLSERRVRDERIRQSEERFRSLVAGVRDYAIFMLDPQGHVMTWNAGAQAIKGYDAQEIIGSHFSRFYPPEAMRRGLPETELRGATMEGRFEDEGWRIRKDGSRFWANVVITAMRDDTGRLLGFSKITRNLTERRRHEDDLRQSEERFRLLVDGVTEYAIILLDQGGFVTSWNAGAERVKGYKAEEILGKHVSHFYPAEDIAASRPWADMAIAREEGRMTSEGWRVRKDGTLFWASTVVTALEDAEGRHYGFAKVTQDLTQRRHAEALAETAQRMHEFIAMLAHELRNPLAPIRNAVALMGRKGMGDPTLESMRQTIERQSVLLTRLLDELLDVNRIARGEFAIERTTLDLQDVVTRAVEASRPLIDAREHQLEISMPAGPVPVVGDAVRLTQALVNVLNNAAKYTQPGGRIWLSTSVRSSEIELRVRDNGRGIAPDKLENVFDLFVQIDPQGGSALGGLGVGLALVRRVVELHGGSVRARSEGLGSGTEFVIRLPVTKTQLRAVHSTGPMSVENLKKLRVLVVDDNKDAADSLHALLESMNQDVCTVYDGPAALAAARTFAPDVVLLDIGMPVMSGYTVAGELQKAPAERRPVLVAVTGWGQEADRLRAREVGFQHHFVKPMSVEGLRTLLTDISESRRPRP